MKKVIILFIGLVLSLQAMGQVQTGVKDNVTYIVPSVENFITLCNCSQAEFQSIMNRYHYSENGSSAQWLSYMASLDNFLVHAVTNFDYSYGGGNLISWLPKDEMYPRDAMSTIYSKLRPHYIGMEDGLEKFAFNYKGFAYGMMISNTDKAYIIRTIRFSTADSRLSELK